MQEELVKLWLQYLKKHDYSSKEYYTFYDFMSWLQSKQEQKGTT